MAQAWDVLRGDTSTWPDRAFYRAAIARSGQPVLDVGCGTGRLLLDYLAQGIDIEGVDNSPDMLALCRAKAQARGLAPRLYEQAMETLALPRTYRTILIPSSSLQLLVGPAQVDEAMRRVTRHLEPGGAVVASFMALRKPGDPLEGAWEQSAIRAADGATFRRLGRSRYDPALELEHTEEHYQVLVDGMVVAEEVHRRSPATRSYTQAQARGVFERAGLVGVELCRGFSGEAVTSDDTMFTVVGRRAGTS